MRELLQEIRTCTICQTHLDHAPRPILSISNDSKVLLIGQAPGQKVHHSGIPWQDASGKNLRSWLGVDESTFYDPKYFGILPMGFCYPGKGTQGDLPPRKECAPQWHQMVIKKCQEIKLTILLGKYAHQYYLRNKIGKNLTETVKSYKHYLPQYFVLPHPSPRNRFWMRKNPWFASEVLPVLQHTVKEILDP